MLKKWVIFRNKNRQSVPVESLLSPKGKQEKWLDGFIVPENDYFEEMEQFLLNNNSIYSKIIIPNWNVLISNDFINENIESFYQSILN